MILGVSGKYCAGKDSVVAVLRQYGFNEINVDKLGHQVLEDKKESIVRLFGKEILSNQKSDSNSNSGANEYAADKSINEHGADKSISAGANEYAADKCCINRRALGKIVFNNPKCRKQLESIVHPEIIKMVNVLLNDLERTNVKTNALIVINAAILFRMGLEKTCDAVICVSAPFFIRLKRALSRDSLSLKDTLSRLSSQKIICPKSKQKNVDIYHIRNHRKKKYLKEKVVNILNVLNILKKI